MLAPVQTTAEKLPMKLIYRLELRFARRSSALPISETSLCHNRLHVQRGGYAV